MKSDRISKLKRWVLIPEAVALLGLETLEEVRDLAEKYEAIRAADGLVWINVNRIKREAVKNFSRRTSRSDMGRRIHKFEMHVGRLRQSAEVQFPNLISAISKAIKDANLILEDAASLPIFKRKAQRRLIRSESKLLELNQRLADTLVEIDRLARLDDEGVARWYAAHGWEMPTESINSEKTV